MSEYVYEEIVSNMIIDGLDCSTVRIGERREEIVRCRDCLYHYTRNVVDMRGEVFDTDHFCELMLNGFGEGNNEVSPEHFCAWGSKREGERW